MKKVEVQAVSTKQVSILLNSEREFTDNQTGEQIIFAKVCTSPDANGNYKTLPSLKVPAAAFGDTPLHRNGRAMITCELGLSEDGKYLVASNAKMVSYQRPSLKQAPVDQDAVAALLAGDAF